MYQFLNVVLRKWRDVLTLDKLNAAIADWDWQGCVVPAMHHSVKEGTRGGLPSPGAHVRYTASQTVEFARALEFLIQPYIADEKEPAWLCWKAHIHYFNLKMARSFTPDSIAALEIATVNHQVRTCARPRTPPTGTFPLPPHTQTLPYCAFARSQMLFNAVPEYKGLFVYKHHAALHSAHDTAMCGPACNRTARMYENKLQYVKRRAKASNFKTPIYSVLRAWSLQTARDLVHMASAERHEVQLIFASDACLASEDMLCSMADDPVVQFLSLLLYGGGADLYYFEEIASFRIHSVVVSCGSFVQHWSDTHAPCLAIVSRVVRLRREEEPEEEADVWVMLARFPGVPMSTESIALDAEIWMQNVADVAKREIVCVILDDMRFTLVHQHTLGGQFLFMPA